MRQLEKVELARKQRFSFSSVRFSEKKYMETVNIVVPVNYSDLGQSLRGRQLRLINMCKCFEEERNRMRD